MEDGGGGAGGATLSVVIKPTSEREKFTVQVAPDASVADLKEQVAQQCGVPAGDQRLIYKGQVLKDEKKLSSDYGEHWGFGAHAVVHSSRQHYQANDRKHASLCC